MDKYKNITKEAYEQLVDRIKNDAPVESMFKGYNPYDIRDALEESIALKAGNKDIRDFYEKPELFSNVTIKAQPNMRDNGMYKSFVDQETGLWAPNIKNQILLKDKSDIATLGHELQHHYDKASNPLSKIVQELPEDEIIKNLKKEMPHINNFQDIKGLEGATKFLKDHFNPDPEFGSGQLKQFLNLKRMIKGGPLKMIAPIAMGAAAFGIGEKAYAGDLKGAGKDTIDLLSPMSLQSDNLNANEEELLRQQENQFQQQPEIRRFEKIRNLMRN